MNTLYKNIEEYTNKMVEKYQNSIELFFYIAAFLDALLISVPIEILYVPAVVKRPDLRFRLAHGAVITGAFAGLLGYAIGFGCSFFEFSQMFSIVSVAHQKIFVEQFSKYAFFLILLKPPIFVIPFNILTILCGWNHYNIFLFTTALILTKMRIYIFAWFLSPNEKGQIEKKKARIAIERFAIFFASFALIGIAVKALW